MLYNNRHIYLRSPLRVSFVGGGTEDVYKRQMLYGKARALMKSAKIRRQETYLLRSTRVISDRQKLTC